MVNASNGAASKCCRISPIIRLSISRARCVKQIAIRFLVVRFDRSLPRSINSPARPKLHSKRRVRPLSARHEDPLSRYRKVPIPASRDRTQRPPELARRLAPDRPCPREEIRRGRWLRGHDPGNNLILLHFFTGGDLAQDFEPLLLDLLHTVGFHGVGILHGSPCNNPVNSLRREDPL